MVKMSMVYEGGLRCVATHGPSGKKLDTDAPVDNHGRGESFSPTDLVATALAACMATIMGIVADRHGWGLEGMRMEVSKEMTTEPPRRIARLTTEIWIPIPASQDPNRLLERGAATCPVHRSLHPEVEKPVIFHYAKEADA
jgi:putative redox protein